MLKQSFIYLSSSILNRLTPFLLIPLLTHLLTPEEYGVVTLYQVAISFGIAICGFGLHLNVAKNFPRMDSKTFSELVFVVLLILGVSCLIAQLAILVGGWRYGDFLGMSLVWWLTIPLVSFFSMVTQIGQSVYRSSDKPWHYASVEVSITSINLLLSVILVVLLTAGASGRQAAIAISAVIGGALSFYLLLSAKRITYRYSGEKMRDVLKFSLPLLPHTVASALISMSDRFFLAKMVGNEELGIYSVGYSFGMVILLVTDAYAKAWTPWFLREVDKADGLIRIKKRIFIFSGVLLIFSGAYALVSYYAVPFVVGSEYADCIIYIPIICAAYYFFGLYQSIFPYLIWLNKTAHLSLVTVSSAIVNVILNYFLILDYGAIGAAWATLASYAMSFLLIFLFVSRQSKKLRSI